MARFGGNKQSGPIDVATAVNAHGGPHGRLDFESETFIAYNEQHAVEVCGTLKSCKDSGGWSNSADHAAAGYMAPVAFHGSQDPDPSGDVTHPLGRNSGLEVCVAFLPPLTYGGGKPGQGYPAIRSGIQVRRPTPLECCRLQGFPDHYLDIEYRGRPAADGPKYKALGNSMATNVMRWIGERIHNTTRSKYEQTTQNPDPARVRAGR